MMPSSSTTVAAFTSSSVTTTLWVGETGVRSARTMKVTKADSSARPTTIGPTMRDSPRFAGAPASAASAVAACATGIGPCEQNWKSGRHVEERTTRLGRSPLLMLLYNNVAELRRFRGAKAEIQLPVGQ